MGGVVRFRISRSAVHDEFVPVQLFHKRLGINVEGRRCQHCDKEFLNKNKTNLNDHLQVFHNDVYQRALAIDNLARAKEADFESLFRFPTDDSSLTLSEISKRTGPKLTKDPDRTYVCSHCGKEYKI